MKVQVEYTGVLHIPSVESGAWVEIADSATVAELLQRLDLSQHHRKYIAAAVNGRHVKHNHRLADDDRVLLSLPMGGG